MNDKVFHAMAFSGGGVHTTSYIGTWKFIHEEKGYTPDLITGTSGGALFGCFMAAGLESKTIEKELLSIKPWKYFRVKPMKWLLNIFSSWGMLDIEIIRIKIKEIIDKYNLDWRSFKETRFQCVVTDLTDGTRKYIPDDYRMPLDAAITASIAIPGVFKPLWYPRYGRDQHCFVDGGLCEGFPIKAILEKGIREEKIMAITPLNLKKNKKHDIQNMKNYFQGLYTTLLNEHKRDMSDLLDEKHGDICIFSGSVAKNSLNFSAENIKKNIKLGYENAKKEEENICTFFK